MDKIFALIKKNILLILLVAAFAYFALNFNSIVGTREIKDYSLMLGTEEWQAHTDREINSASCKTTTSASNAADGTISITAIQGYDCGTDSTFRATSPALPYSNTYTIKVSNYKLYSAVADAHPAHAQDAKAKMDVLADGAIAYELTAESSNVGDLQKSLSADYKIVSFKKSSSGYDVFSRDCDTCQEVYYSTLHVSQIKKLGVQLTGIDASALGHNEQATATAQLQPIGTQSSISAPVPLSFSAPDIFGIIGKIKDWIVNALSSIKLFSITGISSPLPSTSQTYQVNLTAPTPVDDSYADGSYSVRYCDVALVKDDGSVIDHAGMERCYNDYSKQFITKLPSTAGKYLVVAVMSESKGTYNANDGWKFSDYSVIQQDAYDVTSKAPIPVTPSAPNFFAKILAWFANLFK